MRTGDYVWVASGTAKRAGVIIDHDNDDEDRTYGVCVLRGGDGTTERILCKAADLSPGTAKTRAVAMLFEWLGNMAHYDDEVRFFDLRGQPLELSVHDRDRVCVVFSLDPGPGQRFASAQVRTLSGWSMPYLVRY